MANAAKIFKPGILRHKPAAARPNSYRRGYGGKKWERTRQRIFKRDKYICQICGGFVIAEENKQNDDNKDIWAECDHIIPVSKGGSDKDENLQTTHKSCHSKKTRREQGGRVK